MDARSQIWMRWSFPVIIADRTEDRVKEIFPKIGRADSLENWKLKQLIKDWNRKRMGSQFRAMFGHVHVQKQRKSPERKGGRKRCREHEREREAEGQKQERQILSERQPHESFCCSVWLQFHMSFDWSPIWVSEIFSHSFCDNLQFA